MKKLIIGIVVLFLCMDSLLAQGFKLKRWRYTSVASNLNAMNYVGDLDPGPSFVSPGIKFTRYNLGCAVSRRYTKNLSLRLNLSYGRIKGSDFENAGFGDKDIFRRFRNLSFRNQILEVKTDVVIDLLSTWGAYRKRPDFTPYLFVGLAYFKHNPQARTIQGNWVDLRPLSTEGQGMTDGPRKYSLHQIAFPVGLGFKYKLGKRTDLAFEIGWRFTTTDYIDDVGGRYPDKEMLRKEKGDLAVEMSDRSQEIFDDPQMTPYIKEQGLSDDGNGNQVINGFGKSGDQRGDLKGRNDLYIVTGFHLIYIIDGVKCPKFRL